jgi:hypothetical protein
MKKLSTPQTSKLPKSEKDLELLLGRINQIRPDAVGTFRAESDEMHDLAAV